MKSFQFKRGYTLLFAVLTAALVLGVAVFILSVSRKQYILSATARDSLYSFYAADSGIECVVKSSDNKISTTNYVLNCNGSTVNVNFQNLPFTDADGVTYTVPSGVTPDATPAPVGAAFNLGFKEGTTPFGCAKMNIIGYSVAGNPRTVIQSRGYNLCTPTNGPDTSQRTVERAIQLKYD